MLPFITPDSTTENFGESISCLLNYESSVSVIKKDVEIFTDYISVSQIYNVEYSTTDFVNDLFETQEIFDSRQFTISSVANSLFKNSRTLNAFEENALNEAFAESLIEIPTLKGRR